MEPKFLFLFVAFDLFVCYTQIDEDISVKTLAA
jgi:hypothetical protein